MKQSEIQMMDMQTPLKVPSLFPQVETSSIPESVTFNQQLFSI